MEMRTITTGAPQPLGPLAPVDRAAAPADAPVREADGPAPLAFEEQARAYVQDDGEMGGLPWEQPQASANEPLFEQARALGLGDHGLDRMRELDASGALGQPGGNGRSLGEEIVWRLDHGFVDGPTAEVLLDQIADPDANVRQISGNTCAAATAQKAMAESDPSLYFVTAADMLRSGGGRLPDGSSATLSAANRAFIAGQGYSPAERVDATFQAALMDYANGADTYDLASDTSTKADGTGSYQGVNQQQATELNQAALRAPTLDPRAAYDDFMGQLDAAERERERDHAYRYDEGGGDPGFSPPRLMDVIMSHLLSARSQNFPGVMVPVRAGDSQHMVLVSNIDLRRQTVTVEDANGRERTMTCQEFTNQVAFDRTDGDGGIGAGTGSSGQQTSTSGRGRG